MEEFMGFVAMSNVYVISDNIISSCGFNSTENFSNLVTNKSFISINDNKLLSQKPIYLSLIDKIRLENTFKLKFHNIENYSFFEKLNILSISNSLENTNIDISSNSTLLIFSSTKGNIELLNNHTITNNIHLWNSSKKIINFFNNQNKPLIISNACISGLLAIIIAYRLLNANKYKNIIITGADILSEFIVSGFQSFKAISSSICKPFDIRRDGITLGEACGTIILSNENYHSTTHNSIIVKSGISSNDSNHISGPSRNGNGLKNAILKTIYNAGINTSQIDYISSHGTGTIYNDEMESKALSDLNLLNTPLNSFKAYWGHTLGAAGIIESIAGIHSLKNNILIKSLGYKDNGVTNELNIIKDNYYKDMKYFLKIGSGFGGCNASILFEKDIKN